MPTIPIVPETVAAVPFAVTPSNVTEAKLIAAYAEWDGTGASGAFLPCLAIYSDAGVRLGRVFPSSTVAKGDSAVVTYAPFPGGIGQKQSSGGAGLQYGGASPVYGAENSGDYLHSTTTVDQPTNGPSVEFTVLAGVLINAAFPENTTGQEDPLSIVSTTTAHNVGWEALFVSVDDGGEIANSPTGATILSSKSGTGAGGSVGINPAGNISGGSGDAVGVLATADNSATGREIAGQFQTFGDQSGANSLAILAQDHTGANIFEVRDDGSVHIKTGTSIVADL